jgi:hypothetical protein
MRRIIPAVLTSGALMLALSMAAPVASAQAQATTDQPTVGAWLVHPFAADPGQVSLMVFDPGGTLVNTDQDGTTGLGVWKATGDRTFDLTFEEPIQGQDGSPAGIATIRASGEVAKDGQSFSGTWTFEPPAAMSALLGVPAGQLGPGDVTGERLSVSSMGKPVGALPDFNQMAPPSPGPSATP